MKILKFSEIFTEKMYPYFKKWEILEIWEKFTKWMFFHEKSKILPKKMYPYLKDFGNSRKVHKVDFFHEKSKILEFSEIFRRKKVYFKKYKIENFAEKSN